MPRLDMKMEVSGPVFDQRGGQMVDQAIRGAVRELVEKSEQRLDTLARPRPGGVYLSKSQGGRSTGNYRRNISGKVSGATGSFFIRGEVTDGGVIYGPWLEGTGSRNQTTRFKGYRMFRKTRQWAEEQEPKITKTHVNRLVGKMNR